MSEKLKLNLKLEVNKVVLHDNPIFEKNFSKEVIENTVQVIDQ